MQTKPKRIEEALACLASFNLKTEKTPVGMKREAEEGFNRQKTNKEKAVQSYKQGKVTFSEAAHRAGLTVWEMREYMIEKGFVSSYSLEDLEQEMKLLNK